MGSGSDRTRTHIQTLFIDFDMKNIEQTIASNPNPPIPWYYWRDIDEIARLITLNN
jgi:hypothetical protein